jgi:LmbE family N-acetylglucosaminyl deacetylase
MTRPRPVALAIAAHPDDIEFRMAGTLLLLRAAGWDTHYFNLSAGNCGSARMGPAETTRKRRAEAQRAASLLDAVWHPSCCRDLEITYTIPILRKVAAVIREVKPTVVLTHPPVDYMEDHTATCRLAVTAAFSRGMPNFRTTPSRPAFPGEITVYHCTAHGLVDPLNRPMTPEFYIDTTSVQARKLEALAAHESQQDWLDRSQGMNSYLKAADDESLLVGRASGKFRYAEGWWRHSSTGFCAADADPLREALGSAVSPRLKASARR